VAGVSRPHKRSVKAEGHNHKKNILLQFYVNVNKNVFLEIFLATAE